MTEIRPKFLLFLNDYILLKLAYHLKCEPRDITVRSMQKPTAHFDLVYQGETYAIKLSNPVIIAKNDAIRWWDFDVRANSYQDKKNKRLKREGNICDYYLLIGMENNIPQKMFVIPAEKTPTSHVRISVKGKSKYSQYEI